MAYKKKKRTISQEQVMKMQEGRRLAAEKKKSEEERAQMLQELDDRLAEGRGRVENPQEMLRPSRRRHKLR